MSEAAFVALARTSTFAPDPRFGTPGQHGNSSDPSAAAEASEPAIDPCELAREEGYARGLAEAEAAGAAALEQAMAARGAIEIAVQRLNDGLIEDWRQRLEVTVTALCDAALAPLAIDPAALAARIDRAAAMLARADDKRLLRLHPADLELVHSALPAELPVEPDPALPRGTVRIESVQGGVEDGPESWRTALAEALAQC